jgi:bile acid:Na+ symporter, BASS family
MFNAKNLSTINHFIHHNLIWLIIASYLLASVLPGLGLWIRHAQLGSVHLFGGKLVLSLPLILLASLLFNAGLGVKTQALTQLTSRPTLLVAGMIGNLLTPLLFIMALSTLLTLWHDSEEMQQILVGLALIASMPIAGASTAWAQNANGNLALLTPLVLHTVGFVTSGDYAEDLHELASGSVVSFLGVWVVMPSLLGVWLRAQITEATFAQLKPVLSLVNYAVLILLNYSNAALTLPQAVAQPDADFMLLILCVVTLLCLAGFASGYRLAQVFDADADSRVSLMFGLGMNNNGAGLVLAATALSDHPEIMLPIIIYNLVQHLIAALVDRQGYGLS